MRYETSAGGVIIAYKPKGKIPFVLLLKDKSGKWTFPKGLVEKNENQEKTAKREISEEVGIKKLTLLAKLHPVEYLYKWEEKLVKKGTTLDDILFYRPKPADENSDGYKSRIGIHEVLAVSPAIREIILHSSTSDAIEAQARKEGMLTMLQDGLYKATIGTTSIEEVLRAITE